MHTHTWKRSTRKHRRPPRFFVRCTDPGCGLERQAIISDGHLRVFHTGRPRIAQPLKNYSIRLTPGQYADVKRWKRDGWPEG